MRTSRRIGSQAGWILSLLLTAGAVPGARADKAPSPESALERLARGDAAGAQRDYESLLSRRPDDARLAFNAGLAAHRRQDWEGAARHFESALGSTDLQLQQRAFLSLGNARARQGEMATEVADKARWWEDAIRQYQGALGLNPADTDARHNLEVVQELLSRLPKPEQDRKDQKDQKDQKNSQDRKDEKEKQDSKESQDSKDPNSDEKDQSGKDKPEEGKNQDPKSKEGKEDSKDSRQKGMGGQDPKKDPKSGKDKGEQQQSGAEDGKDQKGEQKPGESGKDQKPGKDGQKGEKGQKGEQGEAGQSGGSEGQAQPNAGQPGTAGRGQPGRDAGEDSADGRMAVRFAERLLDGHKQDEKALIWRPATATREPQRGADGRRKTW